MKAILGFLGMMCLVLSINGFYSCKKDHPVPPPPPVDSSQIVDLKRGLLLYLPFTGNYADSSGNNNPTTAVAGASLSSDQHGTGSSALAGTGNGERVVVTNNGSIKFDSAFTVSVNVLTHSTQEMQAYVTMVNRTNAEGFSFGFGQGIPGVSQTEIAVAKNSVTCNDLSTPSNTVTDTSSLTLTPETWYNIIAVFNRGTLQLFANGTLISTKTGASPTVPICANSQVIIGGWWDYQNSESIDGKLDEVRMYNRALNAKEITQLGQGFPVQSTTKADLKKGLLLYLPFSGNYADSSGNNNPTAAAGGVTLGNDHNGNASSAMSGTGGGASVVVTNNGSITFDTAFTVSTNVLVHSTAQPQAYITMVKNVDATGVSFGFGQGIPGVSQTEIAVAKTSVTCNDVVSASNSVTDTSNLTLQPETWYNIIAIYHKGTIQLYANGSLISTKTGADATVPVCLDAQVLIGAWWGGSQSINGELDEVRMYNRVLNADEIATLAAGFHL